MRKTNRVLKPKQLSNILSLRPTKDLLRQSFLVLGFFLSYNFFFYLSISILIKKGFPVYSRVSSIALLKDSRVQHCEMKIGNLRVKRVNPGWYCFSGPDSASLKWGCFGTNFWDSTILIHLSQIRPGEGSIWKH